MSVTETTNPSGLRLRAAYDEDQATVNQFPTIQGSDSTVVCSDVRSGRRRGRNPHRQEGGANGRLQEQECKPMTTDVGVYTVELAEKRQKAKKKGLFLGSEVRTGWVVSNSRGTGGKIRTSAPCLQRSVFLLGQYESGSKGVLYCNDWFPFSSFLCVTIFKVILTIKTMTFNELWPHSEHLNKNASFMRHFLRQDFI